jgi:glycolate oxidase FAD binding subunit
MTDRSLDLQARVRASYETGGSLAICGSGSYAGYGGSQIGEKLSIREHSGIVNFEPTEMVVTVRAGTKLSELDSLLAAEGQQLGVECPRLSGDATIGGAIAMGLSGSSRPFCGALRDYVLGVRMLNGLGEDLRFGGQVMKNVAGYDLSRLLVGSRGRLGVLLEISLRAVPIPEQQLCRSFEQSDLTTAVSFTNNLITRAEPLCAAAYYRGRLYLRFNGRAVTLQRLQDELGGETYNSDWWDKLQSWQLPWGRARWRSYRQQLAAQPQSGGDWLADWNGGLIWSSEEEPTAFRQWDLQAAPESSGHRHELEQGLCKAFDPAGIFSGAGKG